MLVHPKISVQYWPATKPFMQTQAPLMGSTWNSVKSQDVQMDIGGFWMTDVQPGTLVHPNGTILPILHFTQTVADEQF